MEVSPLSREVILQKLNPYPPDYRVAFAFSTFPYPQPRGLTLRYSLPCRLSGRATGLPRFV